MSADTPDSLAKEPEEVPLMENLNFLTPAPFWVRMIAFLMDYILIVAATLMISWQILYPFFHPGFMEASRKFIEEQQVATGVSFQQQMQQYIEFQMQHEDAANDTAFLLAIITWVYFSMSELFLTGTTLGKKIFKLTLIDLKTLNQPDPKTILLRNCLKSLSVIVPFLFIVNIMFLVFNRMKLAGHDLVSKTMVVYEYALPQSDEKTDIF